MKAEISTGLTHGLKTPLIPTTIISHPLLLFLQPSGMMGLSHLTSPVKSIWIHYFFVCYLFQLLYGKPTCDKQTTKLSRLVHIWFTSTCNIMSLLL